jgi:hypothetical protein
LVFAELGADFVTLGTLNMFGDNRRFTARDGSAAATSGNRIIRDHLTGMDIYVLGTLLTGTWNTAIDSYTTVATALSESGFLHINDRNLDMLTDGALAPPLNYAPFNINTATNIWTSTTNPSVTANAFFLTNTGAFGNGAAKTVNTHLYGIYVKPF